MRYWRISNHADLSGRGGLVARGRWHNAGRAVVYLADHPAGALLEVLVHLMGRSNGQFPVDFQLLEVAARRRVRAARVAAADLPADWREQVAVTRGLGDAWLSAGREALLHVPSAIAPGAVNTLLNPAHADAAHLHVVASTRHLFDSRLAPTAKALAKAAAKTTRTANPHGR